MRSGRCWYGSVPRSTADWAQRLAPLLDPDEIDALRSRRERASAGWPPARSRTRTATWCPGRRSRSDGPRTDGPVCGLRTGAMVPGAVAAPGGIACTTWLTRVARPFVVAVTVALLGSALLVTPGAAAGVSLSRILTGYSRPVLVTAPEGSAVARSTSWSRPARHQGRHVDGSKWAKVGTFLDIRQPGEVRRIRARAAGAGLPARLRDQSTAST